MAKATGVSAAVFAVLWFPVFWGTVVQGDGNLGSIFDFFRDPHDTAGLNKAIEVLGLLWGPRPEWIVGGRGSDTLGTQLTETHWWIAIGVVLGVAATVVAIRRRSFETVWLAAILAVGFPVAGLRGEQHRRHRVPVPHPVDVGARGGARHARAPRRVARGPSGPP